MSQVITDYILLSSFILLQVSLTIQLCFVLFVNLRLSKYRPAAPSDAVLPVTVVICARNEENNLRTYLPLILEQDHPDFEVVVVNDCSADDSEQVLRSFSQKYKHLKVVTLNEHARFKHGKKFAATLGIKAASNEYLLFTDADCRPASPRWVRFMQEHFGQHKEVVLGYSPYPRRKGFLNAFIRFETFNTALSYLSFALAGRPYMGVGRNMGYTRSLFFKNKGFASHMHIPSGDDDLFVNQNASRHNTAVELRPESIVWSDPKCTYRSYWKQKRRHMSAGKAYKASDKWILSLQTGSALLFYAMLVVLMLLNAPWWIMAGTYVLRLCAQLLVYVPAFKKLQYRDLIWSFPVLDILFNVFLIILSVISLFGKKVAWK